MNRSPILTRASWRISRYGEIAAVITGTPLRESRSATKAMRRMLVSRSSLEKPRPLERFSRTTSPSRISSLEPRPRSSCSTSFETVVLPAPERPVNQRVKPLSLAIALSVSSFVVLVTGEINSMRARQGSPTAPGRGLLDRPRSRLVGVDQDPGHLRTRELLGRQLAAAEHLAHLGAA